MSAETELYAVLDAHAGLAALVGERIYPDAIPEDAAMPAVVYSRSGTSPVTCLDNTQPAHFSQLQISAWGATRTAVEAAADAVAAALIAANRPPAGRSSGFDGDLGLYAVNLEVSWFVAS